MERLAVSKQAVKDMDIFNLKKLKEQCQVTIKNKSASLENLEEKRDINRAWDIIRQNIQISAKESVSHCELKHLKPWFDEECSKLIGQSKQAKLQ
jgi:hypothetical protein